MHFFGPEREHPPLSIETLRARIPDILAGSAELWPLLRPASIGVAAQFMVELHQAMVNEHRERMTDR